MVARRRASLSLGHDPYWSKVILYLDFDGPNDGTIIRDLSIMRWMPAAFYDAKITKLASKFGGSCLYMDGYQDYVSLPVGSLLLGSSDFTIEMFIQLFAVPATNVWWCALGIRTGYGNNESYCITISPGGNIYFEFSTTGGVPNNTAGTIIGINRWYHYAVSRVGNQIIQFIDGIAGSPVSVSGSLYNSTAYCLIGKFDTVTTGSLFNGCIDEMRITKGVARYASNFVPPTEPFAVD
jgi:hypothetical protein